MVPLFVKKLNAMNILTKKIPRETRDESQEAKHEQSTMIILFALTTTQKEVNPA